MLVFQEIIQLVKNCCLQYLISLISMVFVFIDLIEYFSSSFFEDKSMGDKVVVRLQIKYCCMKWVWFIGYYLESQRL